MRLPDVYSDWRIVVGVALLMLGAGNWIVGFQNTRLYARMIADNVEVNPARVYRNFDELSPKGGGAVLTPFTAEQRKVSYAAARMDFYHVTYLTGQVLLIAGLIITALGFIVVIRKDARRTTLRLSRPPGAAR